MRLGISRINIIIIIVAAVVIGYAISAFLTKEATSVEDEHIQHAKADKEIIWTCSMHPQIRQNKPGLCPLCAMDLIPLETEGQDIGARIISFSEEAKKLMQVETSPVERKFVDAKSGWSARSITMRRRLNI